MTDLRRKSQGQGLMAHENIILITMSAAKAAIDHEGLISDDTPIDERFRICCRTVKRQDVSWLISPHDETAYWASALATLMLYCDEDEKSRVLQETELLNRFARGDISVLASHSYGGERDKPIGLLNIFKKEYRDQKEDQVPETNKWYYKIVTWDDEEKRLVVEVYEADYYDETGCLQDCDVYSLLPEEVKPRLDEISESVFHFDGNAEDCVEMMKSAGIEVLPT